MNRNGVRAWKRLILDVKDHVVADNVGLFAAAVAFFAVFSIFPLLIAAVSVYGTVTSIEQLHAQMDSLTLLMPASARELVQQQLEVIIEQRADSLNWGAVTAVLVALWSASTGAAKLIEAVGLAYDDGKRRGFLRRRLIALALTLGLTAAALASFSVVAILPAALRFIDVEPDLEPLVRYGRWLLLALFFAGGSTVLYELASGRSVLRWRWRSPGASVATALWLGASFAFSTYVERFGSYGETYGALGGLIVLMMWFYLSAFSILLGAELNATLDARAEPESVEETA